MRIDVKVPSQVRAVAKRRLLLLGAGVAAARLALACSESQGPSQAPIDQGAFIVSSPVQPVEPAVRVGSAGVALEPTVVYISLPPGAIPNGFAATIRDLRTSSSVTAQVVNGGFDPVALPAGEGDTIAIAVQTINAAGSLSFRVTAVPKSRPAVVRTSPPRHKRDVPLNAIVVIVFSEPLDSATVDTGSVQLWRDTTPVAGTVRFTDATHLRAEFHPDSLRRPPTDYQLLVTTAIRGLNGLALDSAVTIPFATGTGTAYSIGGTVSGLAGAGLVLRLNSVVVAVQEDLPVVADGPFVFASTLEGGVDYRVTVLTQPTSPSQTCVVSAASGTVTTADVTTVAVACSSGRAQCGPHHPVGPRAGCEPELHPGDRLQRTPRPKHGGYRVGPTLARHHAGSGRSAIVRSRQRLALFHSDNLLAPETDYQLALSQGIHGLNRMALDSAITVSFTTGTAPLPATDLVFASVSVG